MADLKDKISTFIETQSPDFVLEDHPYFLEYVKLYYQFLEAAELSLIKINDPNIIQLENPVVTSFMQLNGTNRTKDDGEDNLLMENSPVGDFINGEIIKGRTSGAQATVIVEDTDAGSRLFVTSQNKFKIGEEIYGLTSGAEATISKYRPNPVQSIHQLCQYSDPDGTLDQFLINFRNAFLNSIPEKLADGLDKKTLVKNIKSFYEAKGTRRASEIIFQLLFNIPAEIRYPRDNILRASDGKWETKKVMRALEVGFSDAGKLVGQTITQFKTNLVDKATAVVESVVKYPIGGKIVVELVLGYDSVVGDFVPGARIIGSSNEDEDDLIVLNSTGVITEKVITSNGALYNENDLIQTTGGGTGALYSVGPVGLGSLEELIVDEGGTGYEIGDVVNFSSGNAEAKVSVVNGGFTQEESLSSTEDHIVLEDETTKSDPYTGNKIVQETSTGVGDITDLRFLNTGNGFSSIPTLTITSSSGNGAKILTYGSQIGRLLTFNELELGYNYETSPTPATMTMPSYFVLTNVVGAFSSLQTVTALGSDGSTVVSGKVVSYDVNTQILKVKESDGLFGTNVTLTGPGGTATIVRHSQATVTATVDVVSETSGRFLNTDGWVSESTMVLQDSLLYQDYSYIIKVGRSINDWRDAYEKAAHPAGFYYIGEVDIQSRLNGRIRPIVGTTPGFDTLLKLIFGTILGRRLGTTTDGTSLRTDPRLGVPFDLDPSTHDHFPTKTRDVTVFAPPISYDIVSRVKRTIFNSDGTGILVKQGFGLGPRYKTLNKYANTAFGGATNSSVLQSVNTFKPIGELKVQHTRSSLNGGEAVFIMTSTSGGQQLKTKFTLPANITTSPQFDTTQTKWSSTKKKMDRV
jgi:hypothetical protein